MPELSPANLLQTIALQPDSHLVLALSGGLDSMVLLELLYQARQLQYFPLEAVYVHHGISEYASQWGEFCARQCAQRNITFCQRNVTLDGGDNLEQKARQARYHALAGFIHNEKYILLTAHHADDQLETLLLALRRGAGPAGLSGIASSRAFANGSLCRPLLPFSRAELEQYAAKTQLDWIEDDSNTDVRFERNFIRQQVTPLLRQRWPHFADAAMRSMRHIAAQQELLDHYTFIALQACIQGGCLDLRQLATYLPQQQDLVLRRWLAGFGLNPDTQWLDTLKQQVIAARQDAAPLLQLAQYQLRRFADHLYLLTPSDTQLPQLPDGVLKWQGEIELVLPATCGKLQFLSHAEQGAIALGTAAAEVVFGQLSLRFKPAGEAVSKPLKQWFKLWQIPPWQRQRIPLLLVNGELEAIAGYASRTAPEQAQHWLRWQQI
jgi:tRNA(Ile)-lysidine synthase